MDTSNAPALDVLRRFGANALTDVSGFGLVGHLGEMLRASGVGAVVYLEHVPLLAGAGALVADGLVSSLQSANEGALADFDCRGIKPDDPRLRLLADPQTSGGLLAGVAADAAVDCVSALRAQGFPTAAVVGTVTADGWRIRDGDAES
jgi:selenide,water dikinase